mmetsp:Transcript_34174/g.89901  ORF Transcript_34174/g.89901 Transcript_34174/m.89901 type:complete len:283 (+) Transcript_34174:1190-2038(+)
MGRPWQVDGRLARVGAQPRHVQHCPRQRLPRLGHDHAQLLADHHVHPRGHLPGSDADDAARPLFAGHHDVGRRALHVQRRHAVRAWAHLLLRRHWRRHRRGAAAAAVHRRPPRRHFVWRHAAAAERHRLAARRRARARDGRAAALVEPQRPLRARLCRLRADVRAGARDGLGDHQRAAVRDGHDDDGDGQHEPHPHHRGRRHLCRRAVHVAGHLWHHPRDHRLDLVRLHAHARRVRQAQDAFPLGGREPRQARGQRVLHVARRPRVLCRHARRGVGQRGAWR